MKLLYVTPLWKGLEDVLFNRKSEAQGMPAFIEPLKKIIEGNHVELFIVGKTNKKLKYDEISCEFAKKSKIHYCRYPTNRLMAPFYMSVFFCRLFSLVRSGNFDFVYCHGSLGGLGVIVSRILRKPCGVRIYGTFLSRQLNENKIKLFFQHPLEFCAFALKSDFLLITNDGTKGNLVSQKLRKKDYPMYFWLNGIHWPEGIETNEVGSHTPEEPFLLYPARIAGWKRQHLALELLFKLRKKLIINNIKLIFVGHVSDTAYFHELKKNILVLQLEQQVSFLGAVCKKDLFNMYRKSLSVLSFYEVSNLGNVSIEVLAAGGVLCAWNDGSLDGIVKSGENGFLINSIDEGAEIMEKIINNEVDTRELRRRARKDSEVLFHSWDDRVQMELNLIQDVVLSSKIEKRS